MEYHSIQELVTLAGEMPISDVVLKCESEISGETPDALKDRMLHHLQTMFQSIEAGMNPELKSNSGLVGGQASKLAQATDQGQIFSDPFLGHMEARALAVAECNASMGKIVAAPTAGSCGILPSALFAAQEKYGYSEKVLVNALFTAAGIGAVIADRASISGAEGGCQAECGTAAAMAAAALTQLRGGDAKACANAVAFTLMNMMGLVCDPLNGLVEIPCVYRNVSGAANAAIAADMALAGLVSVLSADDLIDAMGKVGRMMPESLRETGKGGCATCPISRA